MAVNAVEESITKAYFGEIQKNFYDIGNDEGVLRIRIVNVNVRIFSDDGGAHDRGRNGSTFV